MNADRDGLIPHRSSEVASASAGANRDRSQCSSCSVWAGTCPDCGTYWLRRPDGKALGLRPLMNGHVVYLTPEQFDAALQQTMERHADPEWRLFWQAHQSVIDRTWESAHPDGWTRKKAGHATRVTT